MRYGVFDMTVTKIKLIIYAIHTLMIFGLPNTLLYWKLNYLGIVPGIQGNRDVKLQLLIEKNEGKP